MNKYFINNCLIFFCNVVSIPHTQKFLESSVICCLVNKSCPTPPGSSVLHYLLDFAQIHAHLDLFMSMYMKYGPEIKKNCEPLF